MFPPCILHTVVKAVVLLLFSFSILSIFLCKPTGLNNNLTLRSATVLKRCALNTIHYGENIHYCFYILHFSDICYFFQYYMKNKIGILENYIYIFPVVNSVNLFSCFLSRFPLRYAPMKLLWLFLLLWLYGTLSEYSLRSSILSN